MSGWRTQVRLVRTAPIRETLIIIFEGKAKTLIMFIIRSKPYPPNFSKIAANTIEPAIGASTWAFGSHRWVKNIGNFTKNPKIRKRKKIKL